MKKNIYSGLRYAGCLFTVFLTVSTVTAQESADDNKNTPAAFEQMKMQELWRQSSNAAGALLDNPFKYADARLGYSLYNGNYRRPQQGKTGNSLSFNTEGGGKLGGGYVWGSFGYSRDKIKESNFNASIIDPYRGMPYYVADTNVSDWNNQYFNLKMRAVTPQFWNILSLGIEMTYKNATAAKQRDPRTENLFYTIEVKPGIVLSPTEKHHIGLNFQYTSLREEADMSKINANIDQTYYMLSGLGMAVEGVGTGKAMDYNGNIVGGGFQYNYQGGVNFLLDINYSKKIEDAKSSYSYPKYEGTVKDKVLDAKLLVYIKNRKANTHFLTFGYLNRKIDGIEYVQKRDDSQASQGWIVYYKSVRSVYETQMFKFNYDYLVNRKGEYNWKLGAGVRYEKNRDRYLLPVSSRDVENIRFELQAKKNFAVSDKFTRRLLIGLDLAYKNNLNAEYNYGGYYPDYVIVTEFMRDDLNYLASDYYDLGASVVYSQQVSLRSSANLFVKADCHCLKTSDFNYDKRLFLNFSVGCNF